MNLMNLLNPYFATVILQQFTTHPYKKFINRFYLILQISKILFPKFLIKSSKHGLNIWPTFVIFLPSELLYSRSCFNILLTISTLFNIILQIFNPVLANCNFKLPQRKESQYKSRWKIRGRLEPRISQWPPFVLCESPFCINSTPSDKQHCSLPVTCYWLPLLHLS